MWKVPNIWQGGECWIIGGGPSINKQLGIPANLIMKIRRREEPLSALSPYFASIHNKHVIGINTAVLLGDWIDICFFGDGKFFDWYRGALAQFPGLKVTAHQRPAKVSHKHEKIKYVGRDRKHVHGITDYKHMVSWNINSGAAAISIAAHTGVKKIYLLGFDMRLQDGYQHWHNQYTQEPAQKKQNIKGVPFQRHLKGFPAIAKDAKGMGIEIINVNPDSAIEVFPKKSLDKVI